MAEVAFVLSIAFFIRIVVTLIRKDVIIARVAASMGSFVELVEFVDS